MSDKISLGSVATFVNDSSAVALINANNAAIIAGFDTTLSTTGTIPNQMEAVLDMNSNQIINLPAPSTQNSPARLIDVVSNPTITVPGTGTSGHVVPFLDGTNTWSGPQYFKSGDPWYDVKAFGALGNGIADDTAAIQAAINAATAYDGIFSAVVYFPPGQYYVGTPQPGYTFALVINPTGNTAGGTGITLRGCGVSTTGITCGNVNIGVLLIKNTGGCIVENMFLIGKGGNGSALGGFGASYPALSILGNCAQSRFYNLQLFGGTGLSIVGSADMTFYDIVINVSYGIALCYSQGGANWFIRCKFDNAYPVQPPYNIPALAAWQANYAYTAANSVPVGTLVTTQGWVIQLITQGTSGSGTGPTLMNFNVPMPDNTAVWQVVCVYGSSAVQFDSDCTQNTIWGCDLTGCQTFGLSLTNTLGGSHTGPSYTTVVQTSIAQAYSANIYASSGFDLHVSECLINQTLSANSSLVLFQFDWQGDACFTNNLMINSGYISGGTATGSGVSIQSGTGYAITANLIYNCASGVFVANTVSSFVVTSNSFGGNAVSPGCNFAVSLEGSGTNGHFCIANNLTYGCGAYTSNFAISNAVTSTAVVVTGNI